MAFRLAEKKVELPDVRISDLRGDHLDVAMVRKTVQNDHRDEEQKYEHYDFAEKALFERHRSFPRHHSFYQLIKNSTGFLKSAYFPLIDNILS